MLVAPAVVLAMPTGFQASAERRESQGATPKIWVRD